jgi:hypothetical protein
MGIRATGSPAREWAIDAGDFDLDGKGRWMISRYSYSTRCPRCPGDFKADDVIDPSGCKAQTHLGSPSNSIGSQF